MASPARGGVPHNRAHVQALTPPSKRNIVLGTYKQAIIQALQSYYPYILFRPQVKVIFDGFASGVLGATGGAALLESKHPQQKRNPRLKGPVAQRPDKSQTT